MSRTLMVVAAWVVATAASVLVAHAAVDQVRGQVVDSPQAVTPSTIPSTTLVSAEPTTSAPDSITSSSRPEPTSTTTTSLSTTSTTAGTTSTTVVATTSTSGSPTTTPDRGEVKTYSMTGGTVSIEVFPDHLILLGAVPASGWAVAEQELSQRRIEVDFKSGEKETEFRASLQDAGLVVEIDPGVGSSDD